MGQNTSVLFVCLGNICRSPTAEAVFLAKAARAGLKLDVALQEPMGITLANNPINARKQLA